MLEKILGLLKKSDPYLWRNRLATLQRNGHLHSNGTLTPHAAQLCGLETVAELEALAAEEEKKFALQSAADHARKQKDLAAAQAAADAARRTAEQDENRRRQLVANLQKLNSTLNALTESLADLTSKTEGIKAALADNLFSLHHQDAGDPHALAGAELQINWITVEAVRAEGLRAAMKIAQDRLTRDQAELEALGYQSSHSSAS